MTTPRLVTVDKWYHLVFITTAVDHVREIYINGVRAIRAAGPSGRYLGTGVTVIGAMSYSLDQRLRGIIDELMIFDRELSARDVATLYGDFSPAPSDLSTCAALYSNNYPSAFYAGVEGKARAFCMDGLMLTPPPYRQPLIMSGPPVFYYGMNGAVVDDYGVNNPVLVGGSPQFPTGVNGRALQSTPVGYELRFLTRAMMTGSWSFSLWVNFGTRIDAGVDQTLLCEGVAATRQGLHLVERGAHMYFVSWMICFRHNGVGGATSV